MDARMDGQMDGWMGGWIDGLLQEIKLPALSAVGAMRGSG